MSKINNVIRSLEAHKISFTAYDLPAEKLSALEAARHLDVAEELVFKTIVVVREGKGKPILALIPGPKEVDLKALAKACGEKKLSIPTQRVAERLTGLQAGGISPLALLNRGFQMFLDASALEHEQIYISGGQRGINIRLAPADLVDLLQAQVDIICH